MIVKHHVKDLSSVIICYHQSLNDLSLSRWVIVLCMPSQQISEQAIANQSVGKTIALVLIPGMVNI